VDVDQFAEKLYVLIDPMCELIASVTHV